MSERICKTVAWLLACVFMLLLAGCGQSAAPVPPRQPAAAIPAAAAFMPVTISNFDAAENRLKYTYEQSPARVVVTHPGATELLLELGLEDRILSTLAPYGAPLKRVADKYAKLNIMPAQYAPLLEEVLEMQPDMIIGWAHNFNENALGDVQFWHERNIATYIMPSSLIKTKPTLDNSVYALLADMGKIFGVQERTDTLIQNYQSRIVRIEQAVAKIEPKKSVMVLQNQANGQFTLYNKNYLISAMITTAGGIHIADHVFTIVGAEKVLAYDPDYILYVSYSKNGTEDFSDQEAAAQLNQIDELASMRAIREGNIINLSFFTVNNGGIRTVEAIEKIARQLYPERFH